MKGKSEEGIALVAVLWILTLLSVIAAVLSLETRSNMHIARNMFDSASARVAADAGIQRAILELLNAPGGLSEKEKYRPDGTVYDWRFANVTVHISIEDEYRKVDLNKASEPVLAALFRSVGVDANKAQSLAAAVSDFRDADDMRRAGGAEAAEYRAAGLAWGPTNASFQSIEELQQVLGVTPGIYERVAPHFTTYIFEAAIIFGSPGRAYSIRAEARGPNGSIFVREAVLQFNGSMPAIVSWRRGARTGSAL